jgi:uncharacterized protein (DUF433 family)
MSAIVRYPHLLADADGQVRIEGTRYKVLHLAGEHYHYGWSAEELLAQHPDLRPEQVYAALTYFYDHHQTMLRELEEVADFVAAEAGRRTVSRSALLQRLQLGPP